MNALPLVVFACAGLLACAPEPEPEVPFEETDTLVYSEDDGDDEGDSQATGSASEEEDDSGGGFVLSDHSTACGQRCSVREDTCPTGEKCTAVACEPGATMRDSEVCRPIMGNGQPGDSCTKFGESGDGLDTCAAGSQCIIDTWGAEVGSCLSFCDQIYSCEEGYGCLAWADGIGPLCYPSCDPLGAACDRGRCGLYGSAGFVCVEIEGGDAASGESCDGYDNFQCLPGLHCVLASAFPEGSCVDSDTCCTYLCDESVGLDCPGDALTCESGWPFAPNVSEGLGVCGVADSP